MTGIENATRRLLLGGVMPLWLGRYPRRGRETTVPVFLPGRAGRGG